MKKTLVIPRSFFALMLVLITFIGLVRESVLVLGVMALGLSVMTFLDARKTETGLRVNRNPKGWDKV